MEVNQPETRAKAPTTSRFASPWAALLPIIVLATYFATLMVRFAYPGQVFLSFFVDDFFYYLVIAKNLAFHGASTFNGLQATNGYHPLWLLTITSLIKMFGTGLPFFVALMVLIWLLVCGGYRCLRRTQAALAISSGAGPAFALISLTFMAVLSRSGMEVSLALFWLCLFWQRMASTPLERQSGIQAGVSGLLASAVILSRLDACLVIAAYGALTLIRPTTPRGKALRQVLWFGAGLIPVALYFAVNQIEFGTILPISGIAKNLKSNWLPSLSTVTILGIPRLVNILFAWPSIVVCVLFLLSQWRGSAGTDHDRRRVQLCVMLHPFLFYGVLSFSSDWQMWWIWYALPAGPSLCPSGAPFACAT